MPQDFSDNGVLVNPQGFQVDASGNVIAADLPPSDAQVLTQELSAASAQIAELQGQTTDLGDPESQDTRTSAQLQAVLTAAAVPFDPKYNRSSLQALAKEHNL